MKFAITLGLAASLICAAPAMAQLVNGGSGMTPTSEAPIGTKSGGSPASLQAPGGMDAAASAEINSSNFKNDVTSQADSTVRVNPDAGQLQARADDRD